MIRQWLGEKLMALAVRLLDFEKIVDEVQRESIEEDEEDWDIAVHPAVTLGPKALAMIEHGRTPPPSPKPKVTAPLRGSLQDRFQRAGGVFR